MTTLTIDRTGLTLAPLVITGECAGPTGFWLGEGTVRPEFTPRYDYAPDSAWVGGKQLLGVVKEQGALAATIFIRATSAATLETMKIELEDALFQFTYTVTFNDGAARSYFADPTVPVWGEIVPGHDKLHIARAIVSIPVNP
jgi:hypothetical protein